MARTSGFHTIIEGKDKIIANSPSEAYLLAKARGARKWIYHQGQTSTAAYAEFVNDSGETVAAIGKTELTLKLYGDGDNPSTNGKVYTLVYKDADGVEHTAKATATATINGTKVDFVPAVTDFYCPVSFTASAADANVEVYAATAAAAVYCTISTTTTSSTDAQMEGVGSIEVSQKTDQDNSTPTYSILYWTPWYERKLATVTLGAVQNTPVKPEVNSVDVKDFYRLIAFYNSDTTAVVALDEMLIENIANDTVYGVIPVDDYHNFDSKYHAPARGTISSNDHSDGVARDGHTAYLTKFKISTGDHTNLASAKITTYTNDSGWTTIYAREDIGTVDPHRWDFLPIKLKAESDTTFHIKKNADANHSTYYAYIEILEVW